jgi:hypothetical protein
MPPTDKPIPRDSETEKSVSRREFARRAAFGAASAAVLPLRELVHPAAVREPCPPQAATQTPPSTPKLPAQSQAEADFRFQAILTQYPDRFSEAQKIDLKRLCVSAQPPLDRIRAYAISNGDLPALYLKPLVDRDKKPSSGSTGGKPFLPSTGKSGASAATKPSVSGKP